MDSLRLVLKALFLFHRLFYPWFFWRAFAWLTQLSWSPIPSCTGKVSYGKLMDNKNVAACFVPLLQKELNGNVERFTTHESNPSCIKSGCLQVAWIMTFNSIKLLRSHAIHESYIHSCCKTSLPWAGKARHMYTCCCKKYPKTSQNLKFHNLTFPVTKMFR